MQPSGAVFLHGYGVRGYIWAPLQSAFAEQLGQIATPDLEGENITDLLNKAKARVRRHSLECDAPVLVCGHSLGAVVAAVAARDLGPDVVSAAVLIAPPFGDREHVPRGVMRFLLKNRLIPPILLRPRFFSSHTPRAVRRSVFRAAVREKPGIQTLTFESRWFHSAFFPEPLEQPVLVIASPGDRIVPLSQSLEFARVLGASTHVLELDPPVAHDDLFASANVVSSVTAAVTDFLGKS